MIENLKEEIGRYMKKDEIENRYMNKSNEKVKELAKRRKEESDIDRIGNNSCKENNPIEKVQTQGNERSGTETNDSNSYEENDSIEML